MTAIVTKVMEPSSDVFAGENEGVAGAEARKSEHEHRRQPDSQIHQTLLLSLRRPTGESGYARPLRRAAARPRPFVVFAPRVPMTRGRLRKKVSVAKTYLRPS